MEPQDVDLFATFSEREPLEHELSCADAAANDDEGVEHETNDSARQLQADADAPERAMTPRSRVDSSGHNKQNGAKPLTAAPDCESRSAAFETVDGAPDDPLERSLTRMLETQCFVGLDARTTTYLHTTQLTHSNVVSTVVTARAFSLKRRQSGLASALASASPSDTNSKASGSRNQDTTALTAAHVYSQPCHPKKVRNQQKGKYQAQLPSFRRSLSSLPVPAARLNAELIAERDKFMAQLQREREEKAQLEHWAATKIQACYRGYRSRPRIVTFQLRQRLNTLRAIRLDLSDMRESLKRTEDAAGDPSALQLPPWRRAVHDHAGRKRDMRSYKDRAHSAATLIQVCVKRFLARFGYAHLLARHDDEERLRAVVRIQSVFRGFRLRNRIHRVVSKLQTAAILQIQSLIRGIQARERVCILRFEQTSERRRRAGEPLLFTLPSRTRTVAAVSTLRVLYEHRKTRAKLEFKTAKWREEQMYLRIHKVAVKLCINQSILHRRLLAEALSTPKKRRTRGSSAQKSSSRSLKSRSASRRHDPALGNATPGSPSTARPVTPGASSSRLGSSRALAPSFALSGPGSPERASGGIR